MLSEKEALLLKKEISLIEIYRKYPVLAAQDLLGVDLAVPQQEILNSMWNKNFVLISAGRGCGKSFMSAVFAALWAMLYPGQKVGLLAPSFRQGKTMFAEVEKLWNLSPLFREATVGKPTYASDRCYLKFKQGGNKPQSVIESVPLGDGGKIRGARYYLIIVDEFAQMPTEIFNTVIVPMGATVANPMENVRRIAKMDALIRSGSATAEDFESETANKIVMLSSAYFQFNHMYERLLTYKDAIARGSKEHAVHEISYRQMPKGFLDDNNIKEGRLNLSSIQFNMEYEAIWEADSAGVFKASLIEECRKLTPYTVLAKGEPGKEYILGADPARASDAFALCLIEKSSPSKVVAAWEYYNNEFPKMANIIIDICDKFNVIAVHLDAGAGGGGLAMKDLLGEEERFGNRRLLDIEDDETLGLAGNRILYMFNPGSKSNAEAVHAALSLMEQHNLALPGLPTTTDLEVLKVLEPIHATVEEMIRQVLLIEVSQTRSGVAHFDVPNGGGHGTQKKDLFTAFILASKKVYDLTLYTEERIGMLELGLLGELKPSRPNSGKKLNDNLAVTNAPIHSWALKKTFKP
jgi:hypothetical protein